MLAQQPRQNEMAKKQGLVNSLTGVPKEYDSLRMLEEQLGPEHPYVQQARKALETRQMSAEQLNDYRRALMQGMPKRNASALAKSFIESRDVEEGYLPGYSGNEEYALTPEQQQDIQGKIDLDVLKRTTDSYTRRALEQARNVHQTLGTINVDDLVRYSGPEGLLRRKIEEAKSIKGKESEDFRRYHEAETSAASLAKQVRQLLGDSITPSAQEALSALANPSALNYNPEVAKRKYNQYVKILEREMKTFEDAAKNAEVFYGKKEKAEPAYNEDDIEFTARKYGVSREEVIQKLKEKEQMIKGMHNNA
jgi:NACalpha-BTF3-like transcription factor